MDTFLENLRSVPTACWTTLQMMAPYLLLGFLLSGLLSVLLPVAWVKRHLARRGTGAVLKSALLGVPLPLCSCGVLPVATWIRRHGGSKGAVGAFLLSTPQTGVDGFLVALGLLGLGMALFIPVAAFVSGVALGLILNQFPDSGVAPVPEEDPAGRRPHWARRILRHGFVTIAGDIALPLLTGVLIAGVVSAFVDPSQFAAHGSGWTAKLLVVLMATPMYICATASLPIAATMLVAGLSPGTVFVFLMAGPATNAATLTTIARLIGRREAVTYVVAVLGFALGLGMLLDQVVSKIPGMEEAPCLHGAESGGWGAAAAVLLLGVLGHGLWRRRKGH